MADCPLGEDCDLTLAYMMGAEKAKDTIKALRAENAKLRAALQRIAMYPVLDGCECEACVHSAAARAALEGPQDRMAKPLEGK
jgi:hypothetical protein